MHLPAIVHVKCQLRLPIILPIWYVEENHSHFHISPSRSSEASEATPHLPTPFLLPLKIYGSLHAIGLVVMDNSVQRLLSDKLYDKRKTGALE